MVIIDDCAYVYTCKGSLRYVINCRYSKIQIIEMKGVMGMSIVPNAISDPDGDGFLPIKLFACVRREAMNFVESGVFTSRFSLSAFY